MKLPFLPLLACSTAALLWAPLSAYAQPRTAKTSTIRAADHGPGKANKKPKKKAARNNRNNNIVAGNTVVVNRNVDRGYGHPGYHNDWDHDDHDFGEFLGKTVAVTAGVAFLAAGLIFTSNGKVKNITTGASLWLVGAVGLGCGAGQMPLAAMATGIVLFVLLLLRQAERLLGTD